MLCIPVLIVNDFSQTFYSYIGHWSLSKIEHIPWSKKLLNFLLRVRLIRSLAGIIKSLVSSEVDIWVSVAATPRPPPIPRNDRQGKTNIGTSLQTYKVWIQESELWIGSFNPATQASRAHNTGRSGAATQLGKVSIPSVQCLQSWQKSSGIFVSWNKGRLCESWQSYGGSEKQTEIVTLSTAGHILQPIPCVGDKGGKSGDISRTLGTEKYAADGWVVELSPQEQYSWHCLWSIYS